MSWIHFLSFSLLKQITRTGAVAQWVKPKVGKPTSHIEVPGTQSCLYFPSSFLLMRPGSQQMLTQVLVSLTSIWQTRKECPAPGFGYWG